FGSVDNLTSRDFVNLWNEKVSRIGGLPGSGVASTPAPISTPQPVSTGADDKEVAGLLAGLFGQQQQQQSPFATLVNQTPNNIPTAPIPEASPVPIRPVDPAQLLAIVARRQKLGTA